jgi:geranylgeranyl pyrophosphate synthase
MLEQKTNTVYQEPAFLTTSWADLIKDELTLVENRLRTAPPGQHGMLTATIQALFDAGGKRLRPSVCLLTAKLFGADNNHAISLAASVEMLHTATLIHDDLIDGALLRRGAPTLNALWSSDIAVLTGDYLFARAASLVAEVEIVPVMKLFSKTLEIILNGEIAQKFSKWQIDRNEYEKRIYAKTAALFVLSAHSSARLGGADPDSLKAMIDFGRSIGIAFQIVDDVLDYVGNSNKTGKPSGGDLHQGLFTLPAILFCEAHPQDEDIQTLLELKEADPKLIERLLRKIRESGAIEASLREAEQSLNAGINSLDQLAPSPYKDALLLLAEQTVTRDM